jgi:hypothetical protein
VSASDDLEREYGLRIPVVEVDGVERFEIAVDERAFEDAIRLRV